ncbi:MAG: PKD domain-containing protein [Oscillospiraceae bacterium]|nr:PKD domain-containing protein [Oscillospiraceae bacterium]
MKKKITSSLLAAGLALSTTNPGAFAMDSFPGDSMSAEPTDESVNKIDFESSVRVVGQTDTSISIEWDTSNQALKYSVLVNGKSVADNLEATKYNIDGLKSAGEYFIIVRAYDQNGSLLLESNELRAHTNLTVSSNYTLKEDLNAANIYINSGTLDLNGHTLTVSGDVWLANGTLNVNKGKLYVGGNLNLKYSNDNYSYGYLNMQNDEDYVFVNGDMYVAAYYGSNYTAGTLEIKGNFTQKYYSYQNNFYCSGTHKVIFSGESLQTVFFATTQSQFNTLDVRNFSEDGVVFTTAATIVELLDNGCNISFANGERSGWTLEEDETIDGDLNLSRGTLNLNGHKLTVTGNLIQSGGNVLVNGGELDVQGDYRVQALNGENYTVSPGTLTMTDDSDTVKVGGDFIMQSTKSHDGLLSAGTLEIAGDLKQLSGGAYQNFHTSGTHTVVLNGLEKQTVSIYNNSKGNSRITNLKIGNTSAEGVDVAKYVYILGKLYNTDSVVTNSSNLYITATTEFPDNRWNLDANFVEQRTVPNGFAVEGSLYVNASVTLSGDTTVENNININNNLDLNGYTLTVNGDVWLANGTLNVNKGKLYVGGNLNLKYSNDNYSYGYLNMQNDEDYVFVNGDMYVAAYYGSNYTAGTLEIKGNFTQKYYSYQNNFYCSGTHKVIFSGESLQTVFFATTQSQFNTLDVRNFSEDGVVFTTAATIVELLDNGCNISFANGERSGWTLEEDETIDGDLNLSRGTLNLNGHKLTVTGNLIQSGGNVLVNGGELDVQGDYRVQALNGENYTVSPGTLTMTDDSDTVKVGGDFIMQSTKSHDGLLSAGTLEIAGDLKQLSGGAYQNFHTSGTHTVVLNGLEKQTVSIYNNSKGNSRITNLKIGNTSAEGVDVAKYVYILGKLYNTDSVVTNSSNLYITATTEFPDNRWNLDANFVEQRTVPEGLSIGGSVYINSTINLASDAENYSLAVDGNVWIVSGTLNINKGRLYVGGSMNLSDTNRNGSSGHLNMKNTEDYVIVNGNFFVASYNNTLAAGTLEIKGNFTQKNYSSNYKNNFLCSKNHKVILSGKSVQNISFESIQSQFNIVEITKPIDIGYVFNNNTQWNELIENYSDNSAPGAPTNLQFVRSTSTSVMMRWTDSNDVKNLKYYEIYRDGKLVGTTNKNEFIDNGLNTHTQYKYYIVALGANGVRSESSNVIQAATDVDTYAPTTPTGLQAVIRADGSVYLTWIASSDNVSVDGYNLYRNGEFIGNAFGTVYNDKTTEPGYHEYYVEAFDNEGNNSLYSGSVFADNMPPEKPVLNISQITPMRISFKWDSEDNIEIDHFEIYRDGKHFVNTKSKEYTDTSVTAGEEYSYYVIAVDTSGNKSEASSTKKISAKNDEEKPQIGISDQVLTENGKTLRVVCTDDIMLADFKAEVKPSDSEEWRSVGSQALNQRSRIVNLDLTDYLTDSGEYDVRISVTDAAGNTETVESGFTYAKNKMSEFEVSAEADGCSVNLSWTPASEGSEIYYEIRRVDPDGTEKYVAMTDLNELSYTDVDLRPLSEYSYFVIAHDENLYSVKSNTTVVITGNDTVAPTAEAGYDRVTIEGYAVEFDGSGSLDNFEIKDYVWDFGDGSTGSGKISSHIYSEPGIYTATLIVTDESGNTNSDTTTVDVCDKDYCIIEVQVKDDRGNILPSATAYCENPGVKKKFFYSEKSGIITLVAQEGTYDFCFFVNGCLPVMQKITFNGVSTGSERKTVTLTKSELVSAKFDVRELNIEEIRNLGIDVTAPENQFINEIEIKIDNVETGSLDVFKALVKQNGELIRINLDNSFTTCGSIDSYVDNGKTKTRNSTSTLKFNITSKEVRQTPQLTTIVNLSVTEFSWLKDFYEVSVTFQNNAEKGFDILNPEVVLNLPDGLSLAGTNTLNTASRTLNTIEGGTTKTVKWFIKGDRKGEYNIYVDFKGELTPFGCAVEARFKNSRPIKVIGGDGLLLTLNSLPEYAEFALTNVSPDNIYNVKASVDSHGEFKDGIQVVAKYPSGLIEKTEWADSSKTKTKSTIYLPVGMNADVDIFELRTLKPGESIMGTIWY